MASFGRIALIGLLASVPAFLGVQPAAADDPTATLAGEEMLVQDVTLTTLDCDPSRLSTVGYTASGMATGPYSGPFTVTGTVTIQPQTAPGPRTGTVEGPLQSLSETFRIDSTVPPATVIGGKRLPLTGPTASDVGSCQHVTGFATDPVSNASGTVVDIFSEPIYSATVYDASGRTRLNGDASISFSELNLDGLCAAGQCHYRLAAFDQSFLTSLPGAGFCDVNQNAQANQDPGCQAQEGQP